VSLAARVDAIEEAYEFFLGYASQGLPTESVEVRKHLEKFDDALTGLGELLVAQVGAAGLDVVAFRPFIGVIGRDASDAQAAIRMVQAHPAIHSQIIDNLNANIHVRALLTDLFLIDEMLKERR
jgi:hypothetical protein